MQKLDLTGDFRCLQVSVRAAGGQGFGPSSAQPKVVRKKAPKGFKPKTSQFKEDEEEARMSEQEKSLRRARELLGAKIVAPTPTFQEAAVGETVKDIPDNFEARLAMLKAEGAAKAAFAAASDPSAAAASAAPLMPFEPVPEPAQPAREEPTDEERGPPAWFRVGAVGALLVFLLVYGASSDLVMGTSTTTRSASSLTGEERSKLEVLANRFAAGEASSAEDALKSAKALATLGRFDESAAAYAAAYRNEEGGTALVSVALPGEVDSLTRAGKFEASVAAADAFASARGADVAAGQVPDLDTVDLELLRAKARVSWPGHEDEALALYDALVGASREDFRPLLGKGLALASMGRSADAERALIEARFLAPRDARPLVDKAIRAAQK